MIAIRKGRILLVECKAGLKPYLSPKQLSRILEISKDVDANPILAARKRHRAIRWFKITEGSVEEIELKGVHSS